MLYNSIKMQRQFKVRRNTSNTHHSSNYELRKTYLAVTQSVLRSFGITKCYKGYDYILYSIMLVLEDDYRLQAIIKEIYISTASHFDCAWTAVERNIRTVVYRAWQVNSMLLSQMAGYPLIRIPSASQFIEIVSSYILQNMKTEFDEAL